MTYSSNSNAVKISRSDAIAGLSVLRSVITGIVLFMLGLFLFFSTQHAEAKVKKPGGPGMFLPVSKVGGRARGASTSFTKTGKQTSCDTVEYRIRYTFDVDDPAYLDDPNLIDAVDKTDLEFEDILPAGLSATNVTISGDITNGAGGLPVAAISSVANPNDTIGFTGAKFSLVDLDGDGSLTSRSFEIVITAKIDPAAFPAPSMVDNQAFILANLDGTISTTASHDPELPDDGDPATGEPTSVFIDLTDCDTPPGGGGTPESEPCFKVEKGEVECAKDGGGAFIYNMPVGPEMAGRSIELVSLTPGVTIAPVSQIVPPGGGVLAWTITGAVPGMTISLSVVGMELGAGPAEGWGLCCAQRIDIEIPEGIECPPEEEGEPDIKVEKKADVDICNTAGGCDFTITVSNIGDAPYTGKIVLDEVTSPGNATLAGLPNAPWTCVPNISPMVCTHPSTTLNPGEFVELNLSFIPGGGWNWRDIKNCAEYNYDASEQPVPFGRLDNDKACASIPIGLQAPIPDPDPEKKVDLELKKEHGGMACSPDGICYFFIYINNVGTENFNGPLTVVDNFTTGAPLSAEFSPAPPWNCLTINPAQFRCESIGNINLPVGASTRIKVLTAIDPARVEGGSVENCATLDAVDRETNLDNQKDCAKIPVTTPENGEPKIEIEKVCRVDDPGSNSDHWTCKITVTNSGTAAPEAEISILEKLNLLEGANTPEILIDDMTGGITCARQGAAEFDCDLPGSEFAPGTSKEITLSFNLEPGNKFENCATAYERDQGLEGGEIAKSCVTGEKEKLEEETQCTPPLIKTNDGLCNCPIGTKYRNGKCVDIKGPFSGKLCIRLPGQIRTKDNECRCRRGTVLNQAGTKCVKPEPQPQLCKLKPGQIRTQSGKCVCPRDEVFSTRRNKCVPRQCVLKPGQIRVNGKCVCPRGEKFDTRRNRCVSSITEPGICKLKPGQIRVNGKCVCPRGEVFSTRRNKCVPNQCVLKPGQIRVKGRCVCPRGEVFNIRRNKCVPRRCVLKPGQIRVNGRCVCPSGEVFSQKFNKCVAPQIRTCKPNTGLVLRNGKCVCDGGLVWDPKGQECEPPSNSCSPGERYDTRHKKCVSVCGGGQKYDRKLRRCVPVAVPCPKGQKYDRKRRRCVPVVVPCPKGQKYDRKRRRCVPVVVPCPEGQKYDRKRRRCVPVVVPCPKGQKYDRKRRRCVPVVVPCPEGQKYDRKRRRCVPVVVPCPEGQKYDRKRRRCVPVVVPCPKGQKYDRKRRRCVPVVVPCPKGQKYDRKRRRCVPVVVPCPKGQKYDRKRRRCVPVVVPCPKGQKYDRKRRRCVPVVVPCPKGQKYDRKRRRCVPVVVPCPKGQKYDRKRRRCVPVLISCPKGQRYDRKRRRCVATQPTCAKGQRYDRKRRRCVATQPTCAKGQRYDRKRRRCVATQPTCAKGQRYDRKRRRCVATQPTCAKGQRYDRKRRRCVASQPTCRKGQVRKGNRCVTIQKGPGRPRCRRGEVLFRGKCVTKLI